MDNVSLNLIPEERPSGISAGKNFIIHDGVYLNPDEVRAAALLLKYGRRPQDSYPGKHSINHEPKSEIVMSIENAVNGKVLPATHAEFGVFQLSRLNDPAINYIHADPEGWAALIYLNAPPNSLGGTAFWKHRATGLEEFPWCDWASYGFNSLLQALESLVCDDGNDPEKWEFTTIVPARYNRMLIFNSRLFHSQIPRESFGRSRSTSRLIQIFFFKVADSAR